MTDEKSDVFGRKRYMERYIGVMEQSSEYREQLLESYKQAVRPLLPYLPWLEQSAGKRASSIYSGQDIGVNSVSFPVYDGTLLNFVREATKSPLMDRNYAYVYTRHRIRTHQEERDIIQKAGWKEWDILRGILSKYVLGGRTKGNLWSEAVSEQIFYLVLKQMQEIIEFWDKTPAEMKSLCSQTGGLSSYFGTSNSDIIHKMVEEGDKKATRVWNAMIYQLCKSIGCMAAVLEGKVDGILLTGGLMRYDDILKGVEQRCGWIAPITVYPGECEQEAMADAVLEVLRGQRQANRYTGVPVFQGFKWDK